MQHAHGTFTVKMGAPTAGPANGLSRFTMTKELHGDLEGSSTGEMIAGGNYATGSAGYVALEVVTGTMRGRHGSFALQQIGAMDKGRQDLTVTVTPGSGSGDLQGIGGTFRITIKDGQHFYDLDYTLAESK